MDLGLGGKVVIVTGAGGGIGARLVERFRAEGAAVVADRGRAEEDLADPAGVDRLLARCLAEHGRVDVLCANAGKWPRPPQRLDETPVDELRRTLDDNLWTAMLTARAFLRTVREQGTRGSSLVLTGSTAGRFGEHGHAAYATAKAALRGLALTLKNEVVRFDPEGRVNLVEPGWTATSAARLDPQEIERVTRTMALRRVASPDDVARAVLFLASPAARHVTGEVVTVAGGMEGRTLW